MVGALFDAVHIAHIVPAANPALFDAAHIAHIVPAANPALFDAVHIAHIVPAANSALFDAGMQIQRHADIKACRYKRQQKPHANKKMPPKREAF